MLCVSRLQATLGRGKRSIALFPACKLAIGASAGRGTAMRRHCGEIDMAILPVVSS